MSGWNWRKIAYFGVLILDVPILITGTSIFGIFLAIIWIAASRTRRIAAWIAAGEPARDG
ncbi:MAG TPA: hypothetical protein VG652_05915 [Gaiellaceae bacterium]|nr:hypothetical protein [Gaiellaceae bacterium]